MTEVSNFRQSQLLPSAGQGMFMKYTHIDTIHQATASPYHWAAVLVTLFALALLPTLCTFSTTAFAAPDREAAATTAKARETKAQKPAKAASKATNKAISKASGQTSPKGAKSQTSDKKVPRAQTWAFGAGQSASAWGNRGVGGDELFRNALPENRKKFQGKGENSQTRSSRDTGGLKLSVDREDRRWEAAPDSGLQPDEHKAMESQHRVRAFATVKDQNLSVGVGPEVIVKDENQPHNVFTRNNNQPDVDAGVGMRFKLDF